MNSIAKKWQERENERLMLMQKVSAQHNEITNLKELMRSAVGTIQYIEKLIQLDLPKFELSRMERDLVKELNEAAK